MSDYQPKDLTGALFRNQKKERPNQPDYTGYVVIYGEKFRLAGWVKEEPRKYLSLRVDASDNEERKPAPAQASVDVDIPF